jgi:hypothetical protein
MFFHRKSSWRGSLLGLTLALAFSAPAFAAEPVPGDACTTAGVYLQSGGPEVAGGGYYLVCDGSVWKSVVDYSATTGRVDVDIANDTGSCTAAKTGRLRYDDVGDEWEYCDGSDPWKPLGTGGSSAAPDCTDNSSVLCTLDATRSNDDPQFTAANIKDGINILGVTGSLVTTTSGSSGVGCLPPPLCPEVGDVCNDGDAGTTNDPIFAGYITTNDGGCDWLFVSNTNQSTSVKWKTSMTGPDLSPSSVSDGRVNDAQIPDSATYPAFKLCKDLTQGGYADWYLPARLELEVLWTNRTAINAGVTGDLTTGTYFSSNEDGYFPETNAGVLGFTAEGYVGGSGKTNNYAARCVRREAPPDITACVPNPLCPDVGDVCDDSNAGTTNDPLFAGFMVYSDVNSSDMGQCKPLYVTTNNQGTNSAWKTAIGANDIATDSFQDGKIADGQIADSATFPAFKLCKDLTHGGFTDWYMPAHDELGLLFSNRAAINANAAVAFESTGFDYWSSTEFSTSAPLTRDFLDGRQSFSTNKTTTNVYTRCVRRD